MLLVSLFWRRVAQADDREDKDCLRGRGKDAMKKRHTKENRVQGAKFGNPAIFVGLVEWADRIITE